MVLGGFRSFHVLVTTAVEQHTAGGCLPQGLCTKYLEIISIIVKWPQNPANFRGGDAGIHVERSATAYDLFL